MLEELQFSKVAHNQTRIFFFNTGPAAQTAQKQKSRTTKSHLMQDWVLDWGFDYTLGILVLLFF